MANTHQAFGHVVDSARGHALVLFDTRLHIPPPAFGSLVRIADGDDWIYGFIYNAIVRNAETPGHRPFSFHTELQVILIGSRSKKHPAEWPRQNIPDHAPKKKSPAWVCSEEEWYAFSIETNFIKIIFDSPFNVPADALIATIVRRLASIYPDPHNFLMRIGKELSSLVPGEPERIQILLHKISYSFTSKLI
ncbi:hypothetical protein HUU42_13330 [bacterium]|nr:hypothetical protein [bacterium]